MKVKEIKKILKKNPCGVYWCPEQVEKALSFLSDYNDTDIIEDLDDFPDEWAYRWARDVGDRDQMIDRVHDDAWAYRWARDVGDEDVMRDRVQDDEWCYWWARDVGDEDVMRDRVNDDLWAKQWEEWFGYTP